MTAPLARLLALLFVLAAPLAATAAAQTVPAAAIASGALPRAVLALYDSRDDTDVRDTLVHRHANMPLNHLGLTVHFWDMRQGLPDAARLEGVRGVLTWFESNVIDDPRAYLRWASAVIDSGRKFVVLGDLGARTDRSGRAVPIEAVNDFQRRLGLEDVNDYVGVTYDVSFPVRDAAVMDYERKIDRVPPPFTVLRAIDPRVTSHLVARKNGSDSHLVTTGPNGGWIETGYELHRDARTFLKWWLVDPFTFFGRAFATDDLPRPDPNTLSGRRIYFSHIDGDGWRNEARIARYRNPIRLAADVVLREAIEPFPDLPVTVGPIAADLAEGWYGTDETRRIAHALFALPQVEAAHHTWTHPFEWQFYERYDERKESFWRRQAATLGRATEEPAGAPDGGGGGDPDVVYVPSGNYDLPRAYLLRPFDLQQEIVGAGDFLKRFLPPGKRVELVLWSGNCQPFEAAIGLARQAGMRNMNGGDSRFDPRYPSITTVSGVGVEIGEQRQILAVNSNENTYTRLWTDKFYAYRFLLETVRRTEQPMRLRAFNVYYHMYLGEREASLNALLDILRFARSAEVAPVTASHYAAIADGFFTARFVPDGERCWRVEDRGALQTVRFDRATYLGVDFARSQGVIGQRHYQGSLYVALDPARPTATVALRDIDAADREPAAARPYLVEARWEVRDLEIAAQGFRFTGRGFGGGDMSWQVPTPGLWRIDAGPADAPVWQGMAEAREDGLLRFTVAADAIPGLAVRVGHAGPAAPARP